jgi:hypothetical protein
MKSEATPEVSIKRDTLAHRWVILQGTHKSETPWADSADAVSVVTWIKTKAGGPVRIRIQL